MGRLYDALYDHQGTIRTVLVRHEQLASVMAEVYGRLTGKPGVAIGQGIFILANGLLGTLEAHLRQLAHAAADRLLRCRSVLKHSPYQSGTGDYGSADTRRTSTASRSRRSSPMSRSRRCKRRSSPSSMRYPASAVLSACSITRACSSDPIDPAKRPFLYATKAYLPKPTPADTQDVAAAVKALLAAKRPVIIAGNGVRIAGAYAELQALAELIAAPVATTASGKGTFAETHALAIGVCGNFGQATANGSSARLTWCSRSAHGSDPPTPPTRTRSSSIQPGKRSCRSMSSPRMQAGPSLATSPLSATPRSLSDNSLRRSGLRARRRPKR